MAWLTMLALLAASSMCVAAPAATAAPASAAPASQAQAFFTSTLPVEALRGKQAVVETTAGTIVMDLLADAAPNHVGHFIEQARKGAYDGTVFHRVIPMGIIQGGDPISTDHDRHDEYGTGGLGVLRFEANQERHTRGAVSAVLVPAQRDSAGSQFFICITDQPALDGQYTVFARVVEGIVVAQRLSNAPLDPAGVPVERLEIRTVTIRDTPPPEPEAFTTEPADVLAGYRARIETSMGPIVVEFLPDRAPRHVRNFLRLAAAGVYDGTAFHRVAKGFVIQGGHLPTRREPLGERQERLIRPLDPEFSDTPHDTGVLSMARLEDPASATTSFFIVTARSPGLDGTYSAFGRVVEGLDVLRQIEQVPVDGETPLTRIEVTQIAVIAP